MVIRSRFVEIESRGEGAEKMRAVLQGAEGRGQDRATIAGFLSEEQTAGAMKELSKLKADIVSAPTITVRAGNPARIEVGQDLRYPSRWTRDAAGSGWLPVEFETRVVGVEMDVTPQVNADGTIGLEVRPRVTEFEGFIGHETPPVEMRVAPQAGDNGRTQPKGEGGEYLQPVFAVRAVQAVVPRLNPGQTVVLRAGERQRTSVIATPGQASEDKVETTSVMLLVFVTAEMVPVKP